VTDRLLPPSLRGYALAVVAACASLTLVLGAHYANTTAPGRIDRNLDLRIRARLADHHVLLEHLVRLGDPATILAWSVLLAVVCLLFQRYRGAVLCFIAPIIAGTTTSYLLKPLVDRQLSGGLAFPSGHTTGSFAVAICAAILLMEFSELHIGVRVILALIGISLAAGVAAAVVGLGYHYTTDTIGGFCVALGVVVGLAVFIDLVAERRVSDRRAL
jgi:undecaprenyl-diphosphatase